MQILATIGLMITNLLLGERVALARKKYHVKLPAMYGPDTKEGNAFSRIQRGHQNFLETLPDVFVAHLICGLTRPLLTSAMCALYIAGRFAYAYGYASAPKLRLYGTPFIVIARLFHLYGLGEMVYSMLYASSSPQ